MKKKIIIILPIILIICFVIGFMSNKKQKISDEENSQERYGEIRESVKKAVEWNIRAMYPSCSISNEFKETNSHGVLYNSKFLIDNGYIKKSELLDVDNVSYCDVYVDINTYFEDPLDQQHNCEIYYKIYLKCKDYEEKGYINWG